MFVSLLKEHRLRRGWYPPAADLIPDFQQQRYAPWPVRLLCLFCGVAEWKLPLPGPCRKSTYFTTNHITNGVLTRTIRENVLTRSTSVGSPVDKFKDFPSAKSQRVCISLLTTPLLAPNKSSRYSLFITREFSKSSLIKQQTESIAQTSSTAFQTNTPSKLLYTSHIYFCDVSCNRPRKWNGVLDRLVPYVRR